LTERAVPDQPRSAGAGPQALTDALASFASGVTLVMIADGRDDIGTTVSAFCPVSLDPPLILVALMAESYPAEAVTRPGGPAGFAVTLLAAAQRVLAGRFAAAGRPGARLLLDDVPHIRGRHSGALIATGGLAALDCATESLTPAGDHLLVTGRVLDVPYAGESADPLIRFRGRYPTLSRPT
jgi:flavin reductase (DIM6/NTAB) family NADH-FMN oxidoreductase RutF